MVRYDYRQRYENAIVALKAIEALQPNSESLSMQRYQGLEADLHPTDLELVADPQFDSVSIASATQPPTSLFSLLPETQQKLERLLAEAIGPVAPLILQATLLQAPTESDLVEKLTNRVPNAKRSQFRQRAEALLRASHSTSGSASGSGAGSVSGSTPGSVTQSQMTAFNPLVSSSSTLSNDFLKSCELELRKAIGPIAPLLMQRTLAHHADSSAVELVEALAQQLADPNVAAAFRRALVSLL
jgi:hypothetical protein